ncbi:MAG: nitrogen fixation protein NifX [Candidatus Thiothrix moscowensis]|nr:nitrogen fixation protein NifX [Candidatus Thiothrix moscowensis]
MTLTRRLTVLGHDTEDNFMETAIKVAFASTDMEHIDQHFGAAESFAIFAVTPAEVQLVEATQFGKLAMDGNEDKLDAKIKALAGCVAVYSQAVGASAVAKLKAANIQPVKVSAGAEIRELLTALQDELRQGPSAWLAQAIKRMQGPSSTRFDAMEAEGWDE